MGIGIYSTAGCLPSTRWQYDMFGADGTVGSAIMSPSDMMGALNDTLLFNSNCDVNRLVASSTALYNFTTPMINSFMAQLAQYWQQMMTGLSSSNNFNVNAPNTNFDFLQILIFQLIVLLSLLLALKVLKDCLKINFCLC